MIGDILAHGGTILLVIGLTSVVGLAAAFERCWRLLPLARRHAESAEVILRTGDATSARVLAASRDDGMARVLAAALAAPGLEGRRAAGLEAAQVEVDHAERGLGVLATVAQIAPLLGLLGTVAGLMQAFKAAGTAETVTTGVLATGIFQALGTTAAGLVVAIPAWIGHNALSGLVGRLATQFEIALRDSLALPEQAQPRAPR